MRMLISVRSEDDTVKVVDSRQNVCSLAAFGGTVAAVYDRRFFHAAKAGGHRRHRPPLQFDHSQRAAPQNSSRSANWIWRSRFAVDGMTPAEPAMSLPEKMINSGYLKFA